MLILTQNEREIFNLDRSNRIFIHQESLKDNSDIVIEYNQNERYVLGSYNDLRCYKLIKEILERRKLGCEIYCMPKE